MKKLPSENNMKKHPFFEDLLEIKFHERFEVSEEMHRRFLPENNLNKRKINPIWIAAAGIILLICINVLSIHHYKQTVIKEELKEIYGTNWNNVNIWQ